MNKFFTFFILFVSLSLVFTFAGNGEFKKSPVKAAETMMIRSPGSFNAVEYMNEHRTKHGWLMAEAAPLSPDAIASIRVTAEELNAIEDYRCETCGEGIERTPYKLKVGIAKPVGLSIADVKPAATADGYVWTMAIASEGAVALRAHITNFDLPEGAALYIYNTEGTAFGPYTDRGLSNDGDFWTHTVTGPLAYLQVHYSGDNPGAIDFRLESIGHLGEKFLIPFMQKPRKNVEGLDSVRDHCSFNEDCVEDASCYGTSTYSAIDTHKYAVAAMQWVQGSWIYMCTGGLLSNTAQDYTPYFLTANHCLKKSSSSLECYFQFWTSSCHGACFDPVGVCPRTVGATYLRGNKTGDYSLFRLNQTPPSGSTFLGWTSTAVAYNNGLALYRLSHPMGAPQAFSKHTVDTSAGVCRSWPRGDWIYSRDVIGATEGGSSGSPVCNASGQVVGQLSGGCGTNVNDVCDFVNNATVDGAFATYYSSISSWLDPN